jgi:hypothetical protein
MDRYREQETAITIALLEGHYLAITKVRYGGPKQPLLKPSMEASIWAI